MITTALFFLGLWAPPEVPADMVAFPAGPFRMGCEGKLPACDDDEQPIRTLTLSAFALDRDLVRVGDYLKCVQAKVCPPPPLFYKPEDRAHEAMTELTWAEAQGFCRWRGRRLPTEAEWARAARGTDGRPYVTGDRAGSRGPQGTPEGVKALMGEAKQWVADWYDPEGHGRLAAQDPSGLPSGTRRVVRGLEGLFGPERASFRASRHPDRRDHAVGFRCAMDLGPRALNPSDVTPAATGAPWALKAISAGEVHTCALDAAGAAWCWGNDTFGQLGPDKRARRGQDRQLRPQRVVGMPPLDRLDSGPLTTCGRAADSGLLSCWGKRRASGWVDDFAVGGRVCAITAAPKPGPLPPLGGFDDPPPPMPLPPGLLVCGGDGDLGHGGPLLPVGDRDHPHAALHGLAGGHDHTCGLDRGGDVWCWGQNGTGQLGRPEDGEDAPERRSAYGPRVWPQPVLAATHDEQSQALWDQLKPAQALALGSHTTCALLASGRVACWGRGTYGMLGAPFGRGRGLRADALGPLEWPRPTPVQGIDDAIHLAAGANHACVIRKGGAVWCWGDNGGGQLGDGTVTARQTPVPVQGLPGPATALTAAHGHTFALVEVAGLWCWGQNNHGQIGDGTPLRPR
ncbi:MAG: SUMF1/EgtB/PvdO family nonheme iron enzyme, partial [Myxococcales bacterium]|nr:SUMF1/EgtB/PvdO family nonheme iron enzyme [Myxococcales bacterium]